MNTQPALRQAFYLGLLLWTIGTILIRLVGHRLLQPGPAARTMLIYLASFILMAVLAPRICRGLGLEREFWLGAVALLVLPTLILDPFACLFFARVYPNLDPNLAGVFGGWMLIFCAGAVCGVWLKR